MSASVQAGAITPRAVVQAGDPCPMAARAAYVEPAPLPVALELDWDSDDTEVDVLGQIERGEWGWL